MRLIILHTFGRTTVPTAGDTMSQLEADGPSGPNISPNPDTYDTFRALIEPCWDHDPIELALSLSDWRVDDPPSPFCAEVGRRLILAELQFSEWILRRVEKARFDRDRSVSRRISLEFLIPEYAPIFRAHDGRLLRLVPLSMMRRRTLVNLSLRDEAERSVSLPGMRLTQQLDQSILLAAAAAHYGSLQIPHSVCSFIQNLVAGTLEQVREAYTQFTSDQCPGSLMDLRSDLLFLNTVNRLRHNFSLYVFLDEATNRHRFVHMAFDEPTEWTYQVPRLEPAHEGSDDWVYAAGARTRRRSQLALAKLGLRATRIRFQVPGAEHAASYHFEVDAPPGVQIVRATLLAGRPNDKEGPISLDRVVGHAPTIGLHAVEIPNGSLCRVQLDLRVPTQGWLSTMMVATAVIFGVLFSVAVQWMPGDPNWDDNQITNVVVLLVTASAAVATLVAQREFGGVAARFVTGVRSIGIVAIALPLIASGVLVYSFSQEEPAESLFDRAALVTLTWIALIPFLLTLAAWTLSRWAERRSVIEESPWDMTEESPGDMTDVTEDVRPPRESKKSEVPQTFHEALDTYEFRSAAIGIRSAEGWHQHYRWNDDAQETAITKLDRHKWLPVSPGSEAACTTIGLGCSSWPGCPGRRLVRNLESQD